MKFIVQNKTLLTYGLTLVNLVAIVLFSLLGTAARINSMEYGEKVLTTIDLLDKVSLDLAKSEADVHNYLLTNEPAYIDNFRQKRAPLEQNIKQLESIIAKDKEQRHKMMKFRQLINRHIYNLESSIQLQKNNGIISASAYIQAKEKDKCAAQIKWLQSELIEEQKFLIRKNQEQNELSIKSREYIIVSASIASLLISIIAIGTIVTDLNEKREREKYLEAMNENKDKFFTLISHDLKGPAHNLIGISEILLNDDSLTEEERKSFLVHLNTTSKKNFALLENLLEWSRVQMGSIVLDPQHCDLWEITQETILIADEKAFQKNITIKNEIEKSTMVFADFNSIKTVLRNLINNSIKFTPQGGQVRISSTQVNSTVTVCISDTGIGMDSNTKKNLFKPGKVVSRYGTQGESGTGIGLLLCKEFIEKNKGKIWVESEEGKGTSFYFTLTTNSK